MFEADDKKAIAERILSIFERDFERLLIYQCTIMVLNECLCKFSPTSPIKSLDPISCDFIGTIAKIEPKIAGGDVRIMYDLVLSLIWERDIPNRYMEFRL